MLIEEKDFTLELNDLNYKFDLYLMHTINAKDESKKREELKIYGYGMSLNNCFKVITNYRLEKKIETTSLKKYIEMYKIEQDKLTEELAKIKQ